MRHQQQSQKQDRAPDPLWHDIKLTTSKTRFHESLQERMSLVFGCANHQVRISSNFQPWGAAKMGSAKPKIAVEVKISQRTSCAIGMVKDQEKYHQRMLRSLKNRKNAVEM